MDHSWKVLGSSAVGTSHVREGLPCQDYVCASIHDKNGVLIVACADGAGSSNHSDLGASIACRAFVRTAGQQIREGLDPCQIGRDQMLQWFRTARGFVALEACLRNLAAREFASTLLAAVVGPTVAAFAQLGDGAIVIQEEASYRTVFWPQAGEYANTTFFLSDPANDEHIAFARLEGALSTLAIMTDGLQPLALHYATRSVHGPFFAPMFDALRNAPGDADLEPALQQFLMSKEVNNRTDDDKTLFLAVR